MRSGILFFVITGVLLLAGTGRLIHLQYASGVEFREKAERQQTATLSIRARRGDILDTKGRRLATSVIVPSAYADPLLMEDPRDRRYVASSIAPLLEMPASEIEALLTERSDARFVWLKRGLTRAQEEAFEAVRTNRRLPGLGVQYEITRQYPYGELAAHVVGFVGDPVEGVPRGLAGIELEFQKELQGVDGARQATVDSRRRRLRNHVENFVPPKDGAHIVLTLDAHVQERTEHHLRAAREAFKADWATAVVMDPQSGEVLAMATSPAFDPHNPIPAGLSGKQLEAAQQRLQNRAIAHDYEPGSIFKPFIAGPAVAEGLVSLDDMFAINGPARRFGRRTIHDVHAYDRLALHEVISRSSNIGMGLLAERLGNARLHRYIRSFGFGEPTGIRLPGESAGAVHRLQDWTSYSTQSVVIGQEMSQTALQMLTAFSALANDGLLLRPRIVRGMLSPNGEVVEDYSAPQEVRRVMDAEGARRFRMNALVEVVMGETGTGKRAQIPGYRVFGKTGTAQISIPGRRGYLSGHYIGSFVGGAPADEPRVVVIVSIYHPTGRAYYGGTVAAPAVGAILADTLRYMQVPPELPEPALETAVGNGR